MLSSRLVETREGWRKDARKADEKIMYCPKCRKCYEIIKHNSSAPGRFLIKKNFYYRNFVSFGKPKIICSECCAAQTNSNENKKVNS